MPCASTSVSLVYDIHGRQTGEFEFTCEGSCEEAGHRCDWVEYVDVRNRISKYYCGCARDLGEGRLNRYTTVPPPGRLTRCEKNIVLIATTRKEGDEEICVLEPHCAGGCDDEDRECVLKTLKEEWQTIDEPGKRPRRVKIKSYACECRFR